MSESEDVLDWSVKQGYILVGGGLLNERQQPGRDFDEEELPHYLLRRGLCWEVFTRWRREGYTGAISGAWSRPLFAGGWKESTNKDTIAFNLQTPSLFIDLRFPVGRPLNLLMKKGFSDCSFEDLQYLARQHCFSGYSFPSQSGTVYTRHHAIDWNFHPTFPRARPNKWRAELNTDDFMSFKEHSTTLDVNQIPVYMERWQRYDGDSMGMKYFAAMRKCKNTFPVQENVENGSVRQAVLIVVGNHFAFALDRTSIPDFKGAPGPGGPPLIDFAAQKGDRQSAEAYLSLEGSYGHVLSSDDSLWKISKSTHPWREGKSLFFENNGEKPVIGLIPTGLIADSPEASAISMYWGGYEWSVFENSFTIGELQELFGPLSNSLQGKVAKQLSRL